tara:strand:- start:5206 stop:5811 length:606 start_codon:yes stop_codon:yes gene_type:complete
MSQLIVKVSTKGEAMIATLQKEIFNRRRKKVTASQVVETLVESGAKSQSDKRYAASWKNLIKDIEKAAKVSEIHGNKPANISADEWALILSHRTRKGIKVKRKPAKSGANKLTANKTVVKKALSKTSVKNKAAKKSVTKNDIARQSTTTKIKTSKVKTAVKKVATAQAKKTMSGAKSDSKSITKSVSSRPARRARKTKAIA